MIFKTLFTILFITTIGQWSMAQEVNDNSRNEREQQTLFGNKKGFGGFVGFGSKTSEINGQMAYLMGGEASFVFGHSLNIGFEGYGMITDVTSNTLNDDGDPYFLQLGYGGIHIEPVIASDNLIHVTLPILLGAGGIAETERSYFKGQIGNGFEAHFDQKPYRSDMFLVAEPGVNLELNVFKFMRLTGGVSYRFVSDAQIPGLHKTDLEGITGNLSLRFGWF